MKPYRNQAEKIIEMKGDCPFVIGFPECNNCVVKKVNGSSYPCTATIALTAAQKYLKELINPIYIEYYSHEKEDCYKINLPYTKYADNKIVLCKVSEGYQKAKALAIIEIIKNIMEVTQEEV